jgi:Family of unknown function (DUF5996)
MMKNNWPQLKYAEWKETLETIHLFTQIAGKIKLEQNAFLNHWWEVAFFVIPRGLTTGRIPYKNEAFEILFDCIDHKVIIHTSRGEKRVLTLKPQTVASFYAKCMQALITLGIKIKINKTPSEIPDPVPFDKDTKHRSYDKETVTNWWHVQLKTSFILDIFRSGFRGKSSPVQFYWGSFDLNTTRFSGKKLPDKTDWPKGYHFMRYAENEENFACGFWPGSEKFPHPAFYSYLYPAPKGCESINTGPVFSYFDTRLAECIFPYEDARKTKNPEKEILNFFTTTYREYARLAGWNIKELQGKPPEN